jgi:hypothetical protein
MHAHSPWKPPRKTDAFAVDAELDAADLGTAFGMECSLAAQEPKKAEPLPPAVDSDETDPA